MPTSSVSSLSSDGLERLRGFPVITEEEEIVEEDEDCSKKRSIGKRCSFWWTDLINCIRRPISNGVLAIAHHAATNPYLYIIGIIHFSLSLVAFGLFTNFHMEVDSVTLYGLTESPVAEHKQWIDVQSGFGQYNARMFFMMIHGDGDNVIGDEGVRRCFSALNLVTTTYGYDEVCSNTTFIDMNGENTCEVLGVTRYWNHNMDAYSDAVFSDEDAIEAISASTYPDAATVDLPQILGNYQVVNGSVAYAESFIISIPFPMTNDAAVLEGRLLDSLLRVQQEWDNEANNPFRLEVQAERTLDDESTRSILKDMPLIPFVFIVMSSFTCFVFSQCHRVKSRSLVGFGAVVSVLLAVMSGYGLLFLLGVPFSMMTQILPFVMFGIGLDDAFIISGAFDRTDPRKDPVERIQETFEEVGLSIVLTTATTSLAFGLGCISAIPCVEWLSYYAFPAVVFDFLYQITFFVAIIVLDERRVQANRMDCCVCIKVSQKVGQDLPTRHQETQSQIEGPPRSQRFMAWFAKQIFRPWVKVLVIFSFTALAVACTLSTTKLKEEFKMSDVVPEDSYALRFFSSLEDYGQRGKIMPVAYFRNVDQSDALVQQEMEKFINDLVAMEQIEHQPPFFWLRDFKQFVNSTTTVFGLPFNRQLAAFLEDPGYQLMYGSSIMLNENGDIESSRCVLYITNLDLDDVEAQIDALHEQRNIGFSQPTNRDLDDWNFFTHEINYYLWEFFDTAGKEVWVTASLGIVSVSVIGFLFIPHWSAVLYVFPMMTVLCIDLLGFLQFCGVTINAVSYMGVMMSIGLLVDFIMHILLRYYESTEKTREGKARDALESMGSSLLLGGLSTFLGIMPLAFSTSKLLRTIFTAFVGMIGLGLTHGLIFLPVVLSLVGTTECIRLETTALPTLKDSPANKKKKKSHSTPPNKRSRHIEIRVPQRKDSGNYSSDTSQASTAVSSVTVSVDGSGTSEGTEVVYDPGHTIFSRINY